MTDIKQELRNLISEINCRREHGADGEEHLIYMETEIKKLLKKIENEKK